MDQLRLSESFANMSLISDTNDAEIGTTSNVFSCDNMPNYQSLKLFINAEVENVDKWVRAFAFAPHRLI